MTFTELDARRLGRVRRFFAEHPPASDVLVCLAFAFQAGGELIRGVIGLWELGAVPQTGRGTSASLVLSLLGIAVLALRRRWPLRVSAAMALLGAMHVLATGDLGPFAVGFALAVYVVAATRPQWIGWVVLGGGAAVMTAALIAWGSDEATTPEDRLAGITEPDTALVHQSEHQRSEAANISLLLSGLIAMTVGTNVRGHRLHTRSLVERHQQLVEAGEQQAKLAVAAEQARIAREMHDVVAHGLTVMIALSDGARTAMHRSPDDAETALTLVSETGRSALTDMRRMLGVLRGADVPLEPQPGEQDLDALVQSFRAAGMSVRLTTTGAPLPTDAGLALTVYRVVQESLTNALRHAGTGSRVDVRVRHGRDRIDIEVEDDGGGARPVVEADGGRVTPGGERVGEPVKQIGDRLAERTDAEPTVTPPSPIPRIGRGLVGMRERAAVYRGHVEAGPHHGGWRVQVELHTDDVIDTPEEYV